MKTHAELPIEVSSSADLPPSSGINFDEIANSLRRVGICVIPNALPDKLFLALKQEGQQLTLELLHPAGIGGDATRDITIRSDLICWLEGKSKSSKSYLDFAENLRLELNKRLFLGLFDYECHYARYDPGAFYGIHLDALQTGKPTGQRNRVISTILYLNDENWQPNDGGQLRIYASDGQQELLQVQPLGNSLVLFLSEEFPHEVSPSLRQRFSLTGWFRINSSTEKQVDPAL
jgi:SM-20-related protein